MARSAANAQQESEAEGFGHPLPIKLSRIVRYEGQPRRYFDPVGLEELADSIIDNGQQQPVRVFKHSKQPGVFMLIGGERRFRAFHIIQKRTGKEPTVNAIVEVVKDEETLFEIALLDNVQRQDLIAVDEAAAYKRYYDMSEKGMSHSQKIERVARLVKKSPSHVKNYLLIDSLPFAVKKLMDPDRPKLEQLSITAAVDIAKSTKLEKLQISIAKEAIERCLGIDETRMLISMKTGNSGLGVGGSMRRPSDEYRTLRAHLNGTLTKLRRFERSGAELDDLYATREDEDDDRKEDAATVRNIIKGYQRMLKQIDESAEDV